MRFDWRERILVPVRANLATQSGNSRRGLCRRFRGIIIPHVQQTGFIAVDVGERLSRGSPCPSFVSYARAIQMIFLPNLCAIPFADAWNVLK